DERLVNIERRIVTGARIGEARAPRRYLAFAAAAVAAMAGGVIGWQLHRTEIPAAVPAPAIAMHGATMDLGDATVTGGELHVARIGRDIVIDLARGKTELSVTHDPRRTFIVRAGDTEVEDGGPKFSVDYDGGSRGDVRVTEGRVE